MIKPVNISILLLAFGMPLLTGCENEATDVALEKPLRPVRTMTVTKPDASRSHEFSAVVDASKKADLSFKVSGEIITISVKQGDQVVAGKTLARLNDRDLKIQVNEARPSYDKAQADYDRAKTLIKTNVISRADFDQIKAAFNSAKAKLDSAKNSLAYAQLKAPFSGVIAKTYVQNFEEINAKQPIFALHDLSSIDLKIDIPENIMIRARKNDKPANLTATFDAIPEKTFPLAFKEISTQADEVTKTYEVTLTMDPPKNQTILPGMLARVLAVRLLPENPTPNFYLPASVVLKDSQGNFIYTVNNNNDGTATVVKNLVTTGEINQLGIEIFSGIQAGDLVITAGMSKVSAGMLVKF